MRTTVGQLFVNEGLPPDLRDYERVLDRKGIRALLNEAAEKHPDQYAAILKHLMDVGRSASSSKGVSISLRHLLPSKTKAQIVNRLRLENQADIDDDTLTDDERDARIIARSGKRYEKLLAAIMEEGEATGNPYALLVRSGGRGNPSQYNSLVGADLLVNDFRNRPMPVPIYNNYSDGLDPVEYWAAAYGARKGLVDVKMATGDAGFLGKQLALAAHRQMVTDERPMSTRLPVGLVVDTDDDENVGSVLAMDVGRFKAGTIITPKVLQELRSSRAKILIHSPLTSISAGGGLDRLSAGSRERGRLSAIGDPVGITAAQAISEPISQGSLDCLASGTLVRMADHSTKPVESIRPGELVLGCDKAGNTFPAVVTRLFDNGVQPCRRWLFRNGSCRNMVEVVATSEHKILANVKKYSCKAEADNHRSQVLKIGQENCANFYALKPTGAFDDSGLSNEHRALLLGVLLGDGGYTEKAGGVFITCADQSQMDDLRLYLHSLGLKAVQNPARRVSYRLSGAYGTVISQRGEDGRVLSVAPNPAKKLLLELGCYGKYAHEKVIPQAVWGWDNASVASLLAGLFVTDGCIHLGKAGTAKASWHFASVSKKLVEQVRELLMWRYGVHPSNVTGSKTGHKRKLWQLHVSRQSDVRRLCDLIPLVGVKAQRAVKAALRATSGRNTELYTMKRLAPEAVGAVQCWDIEIDTEDHLFVLANGMVVSNSKHRSGVGGERLKRSGFEYLNRLLQAPEFFAEAGPLSPADGRVSRVEKAPQGGHFIYVGDQKVYAQPQIQPIVKPGQKVELGDSLTDGVPHPRELVKYLGVGEGRRRFLGSLMEALRNSGLDIRRRNAEAVVAGLINHMRVTNIDGVGDHLVGDVVPYNSLVAGYRPRDGSKLLGLKQAKGMYLEEPALHYSPGTRITPRVMQDLQDFGIGDVQVHYQDPEFEPHYERLMTTTSLDPDWQVQIGGFYTGRAFQKAVQRGATSDTDSTSYIPALARGETFGESLAGKGRY